MVGFGPVREAGNLGAVVAGGLCFPEFGLVFFPFLLGNGVWVKFAFVGDDDLAAAFACDDTGVSPGEVIHVPEGVEREGEGEDGDGDDVDNHPADHFPLAAEDEDECLETVDGCEEDEGGVRDDGRISHKPDDEVDNVGNCHRLDDGTQKIHKDNESHTEAAETTQLL